jgi:hypothetical protein
MAMRIIPKTALSFLIEQAFVLRSEHRGSQRAHLDAHQPVSRQLIRMVRVGFYSAHIHEQSPETVSPIQQLPSTG